jgi:tetratricopeptide (TPR) repeat protein
VQQAASFDDADADADFYRRLAKTSAKWARFETATTAWQRVMDRVGEEATADDWAGYAAALQGERTRKEEAIRALAKAYELAPSNHQYLHDQAVLVAQTGDAEKAIELFEQYKTASSPPPRDIAAIDARIATLRREMATPEEKPAD